MIIIGAIAGMPQASAGKLRAIAVSSPQRAAAAPELPTIAESGVPGYESAQWYGLWLPAGAAQETVAWLHKESTAVLRTPSVKERLAVEGLDIVANSPEQFSAIIKADISKWTKLVKSAGIPLM